MKKVIMSIIAVILCISLSACGEAKQNLDSEDSMLSIKMQINIEEANIALLESNETVVASLYAFLETDVETSEILLESALASVQDAKKRIDSSVSCPNSISKELSELEENYETTIVLLSKYSELSKKEKDEVINLMLNGSSIHLHLIEYITAFTNLYNIREFDQLPDDEANLKNSWWKFGFDNDIQCTETIDKQDLYLIWGRQFFEGLDENEFLEEINVLRENDDLSNPDVNQKWAEFIESFIFKVECHSV